MQDKIYKVIILGGDPSGLALAEQLSQAKLPTALVSTNLVYKTSQDLTNIDIVEKQGIFLSFTHGLFGITLADRTSIFGESLVIATGTKPIKASLKNHNIIYKPSDIKGKYKHLPAVVFGNNDFAVEAALDFAKRFRYVYLCSDSFELACSKRLAKKIANTANIVHLPNSGLLSCKNDKSGQLSEIILQTYDSIKSSVLLISNGRLPDVPQFLKRYIKVNAAGYAEVKSNKESTLVPGVYAIGGVLEKSSKKDINNLAQGLVAKFKED